MPLQDGALLAFGGDHFTYRVGTTQAAELDLPKPRERPATKPAQAQPRRRPCPPPPAARPLSWRLRPRSSRSSASRTRCDESADGKAATVPAVADQAPARRSRGRAVALWSELASVFQGHDARGREARRLVGRGAGGRAGCWSTVALYGWGASDRKLKELVAQRRLRAGRRAGGPAAGAAPGRCGTQGACHRSRPQGQRAGLAGQGGRARFRWRRRRDRRHVAARPAQSRAAAAGGRTGMAGPTRAAGQPARRAGKADPHLRRRGQHRCPDRPLEQRHARAPALPGTHRVVRAAVRRTLRRGADPSCASCRAKPPCTWGRSSA